MCGIAGFQLEDPTRIPEEERVARLWKMAASLRHRGPDDEGVELHGRTGLAFARLSIIDIEGGHQPMISPDGKYSMVFNGEIYNFRELRKQLESTGRAFHTRSDTEVLLALYEQKGSSMLEDLNGMFALAIHDRTDDSVFLARDRLGIKPLYYRQAEGALTFGSEIKALLQAGLPAPALDPEGFGQYLTYGFTCAPSTIYKGVHALEPGHYLTYRAGRLEKRRYWWVQRQPSAATSMDEAVEQLSALLADSVRLRTVADVPLGALLSGGVDSGLMVANLARHSDRPVKTFSVGFKEERYNELPWAKRVAQMYGTDHTEIVCDPDIRPLVEKLAIAFDQPFGDSSAVPTFLVSEEARRHVTVALSGDGGDEVFAGYKRHSLQVQSPGPPDLLRHLARAISPLVPRSARGAQRIRRLSLDERARQADSLVLIDDRLRTGLSGPRLRAMLRGRPGAQDALDAGGEFEREGGLGRFQHQDLALYLPNDILPKVDMTSMMNSLELRVPLLDHRIVEFGLNLPSSLKNDGQHGKLVLRELGRRDLPEGHLDKPKTGFAIPASDWLKRELNELLHDATDRSELVADGWLDAGGVGNLKRSHLGGRHVSSQLWLLLVAEIWYRDVRSRGGLG